MRPKLTFIILALLCVQSQAQVSVSLDSVASPSLSKTKKFVVLLPSNYTTNERYPILYLLHGYGGSHIDWSRRTKIGEYVKDVPLIVIMPDGENSWYVNSASDSQARFETYMVEDLPAYVRTHYSVDTTRQAIAGLSMGGYGSIMLALKHPGMFRFAGSLSGALAYPRFLGEDVMQPTSGAIRRNLDSVFSTSDSRKQYDIFELYRNAPHDSSLYLYFAMGTSDGFKGLLPVHRMFTDSLRAAKIPYEYHELPGGHSWQFWDREIQPLIKRMREIMKF
ncbi:MAG: alpha/beta hydrolase family protein [Bacteroidota bacterium]